LIFVELLWFALRLAFMIVIYQHTDRIATWSKWEVVMLLGASHLIQRLFSAFFFDEHHPALGIYSRQTRFHAAAPGEYAIPHFLPTGGLAVLSVPPAVAVMIYAGKQLSLTRLWARSSDSGWCGSIPHYSLMLMLATTSF
jgi:ABC-2 type transport system permease protein